MAGLRTGTGSARRTGSRDPLPGRLARALRTATLGVLVGLLPGCAAMFTGMKDHVQFTSNPPGALVRAGDQQGTTPVVLELSKKIKRVQISHPSYEEREIVLDRDFQVGFLIMDILFTPGFGAVGIITDGVTAGWFALPSLVALDLADPGKDVGVKHEEEEKEEEPVKET